MLTWILMVSDDDEIIGVKHDGNYTLLSLDGVLVRTCTVIY